MIDKKTLCGGRSVQRMAMQAVGEALAFAAVLFALAYIAHCKIDTLMTDSLCQSVERQAATTAYAVGQLLGQEIRGMENGARILSQGRMTPAELVAAFSSGEMATTLMDVPEEVEEAAAHDAELGVLAPGGSSLAGAAVPPEAFARLGEAWQGKPAILYCEEREADGMSPAFARGGVLFAVPVFDADGAVAEVYWKLYDNRKFIDRFNLFSYDGAGKILIAGTDGSLVALSHLDTAEDVEICADTAMTAKLKELQHEERKAVYYERGEQHYFLYNAHVPGMDFDIAGYVPWEAVVGGLASIYRIMLVAFCLLMLGGILFARYAFIVRLRTKESEELREAKSQADAANKAKSEFLSNMSHEIRTPINAVLGMDEMILRESREPDILAYAENIRTAGTSLLGLVNDILDFSKIEAGKMDIIPVEYAASSLLNDLVNMIEKRAEKKGLALRVEADGALPSVLFGDEIRLKQIVTNLLTNAVKYTEKGSVTLRVGFAKQDGQKIAMQFSVKDTGIGIKEQDIKKLFAAFERIEEERNRTIEGTGLGMNITQKLLALMGSRLEVESRYGEGSEFSFAVAQEVRNWSPMGDFAASHRQSLIGRAGYREQFTAPEARILVVDDTVMNLTVVKGLLKQTKVHIDTAESGYECLNLAARRPYDIIFLDHRMPGIDGIETLARMKRLEENPNAATPVIALTANAVSGAREEYLAAGFNDYLTKPIDSARLEEMMLAYLPPAKVTRREGAEEGAEDAAAAPGGERAPGAAEAQAAGEAALPAWLLQAEGLDASEGVKHCGAAEAYLDALTVFAESIASGADEIERYYREGDWQNYTTKVHALKSTARIIGAAELSEKARRLEDAGNSGYVDEIRQNTPALLDLYRSYAAKLAPLGAAGEEGQDAEEKPPIAPEDLAEAYETLREVAASFDYDSLLFVLDSLKAYRFPAADAERYEALQKAAAKADWEEVARLLAAKGAAGEA